MNAGRWCSVLALSLALPLAIPGPAHARAPKSDASHSKAPKLAPAFKLPGRDGTVSSDSLRGKVVYVDFWASWCGPCRGSFPWLKSLHERYASKGLEIVAINLDKSRDDADGFLAQFPAPFKVAFDPAGTTAEAYHVAAMPTSYLIARDGTILSTHTGFDPKKTAALEALIQEACAR
jgi:cytochrome c biogenesis protein CcmG, thiol:disulfide interchange protein DsbE